MNPLPRLGVIQRVLPAYRAVFFDALAERCRGGLQIFAGQARPQEMVEEGRGPQVAEWFRARNLHLFNGTAYLCWQSGLLRWLNTWQPQVLIVEANPRYLSSSLAVRWMRARRRPLIGWGLGAQGAGSRFAVLRRAWRRVFLAQFDALITYSTQGALEYAAIGFPRERIFVAPNAAAPRPAAPPPERPVNRGTPPTVLFVGRLQERKRVDLLLRACAALPPGLQPALTIVGDGPARPDLQALADQVYPSAVFTGSLHSAELQPYFAAADLFVLPGTGGLAVQQAMAAGLPVMAAEADGTQADLIRPQNGWQLPPGDLETLTASLRDALSDVPRLRRMGQASYEIVRDEINLERMVDIFIQAVHSVTESNKCTS